MSCYFPIPYDYNLTDISKNIIKSSINLLNYPSNFSLSSKKLIKKRDIFYSLYTLKNLQWIKLFDYKCEFGENILIKRENLDIPNYSMAVVVPSIDKNNPTITRFLPKPLSLRIDKSKVQERCSYNFEIRGSTTSYQGDFPFAMSKLNRGSLLSFDNLKKEDQKNIFSLLLLMHLSNDAENNTAHLIDFYNIQERKVIKQMELKTNSFNSYDLSKISKKNNSLITIRSKTTSCIPIFLNVSTLNNQFEIDVEHTHPPSAFFLKNENRDLANKILKKIWLTK